MRLRPKLALPPGTGTPFGEDARLRWHPSAAAIAGLHAEGKVSVMPAVGYEHPDQSHFVSRHFYEVGALDPQPRHRLAGPLPRPRRLARQPAPGPRARLLARAGARRRARAGRRRRRADGLQLLGPRRLGRRRRADARRLRPDRRRARPRRAGAGAGRRRRDAHRRAAVAARAAASRARTARRRSPARSPTRPRRSPTSPSGSPRSRRCWRSACRCAASRSPRPATTTRTPTRSRCSASRCKLTCDALAAFQRDLEARGLADRVLVHVWSEFGRRAAENAEGTDHGAAGLGLLIGTRAAGPDDRRVPGARRARRARQPARDVRLPRRLRRAARAVARAPTRRASSPTPAGSRGRSWSSEGAARSARARRGPGGWRSRRPRPPRRRRACWSPPTSGCCSSSRQSIRAGRVQIQVYNRGEDAHDLAARRVDRLGRRVGRTFRVRETAPGELAEATWRLQVGEVQALVHPARSTSLPGCGPRLRVR